MLTALCGDLEIVKAVCVYMDRAYKGKHNAFKVHFCSASRWNWSCRGLLLSWAAGASQERGIKTSMGDAGWTAVLPTQYIQQRDLSLQCKLHSSPSQTFQCLKSVLFRSLSVSYATTLLQYLDVSQSFLCLFSRDGYEIGKCHHPCFMAWNWSAQETDTHTCTL